MREATGRRRLYSAQDQGQDQDQAKDDDQDQDENQAEDQDAGLTGSPG